jgi:hypothetical protein
MKRILELSTAIILGMVPAFASAQTPPPTPQGLPPTGVEGRFSFTVKAGLETNWGGDVLKGGSGTILGLPTEIGARSFNDVVDPGYRISFGAGYGFTPRIEALVAFSFAEQGAEDLEIGTVAGRPLRAQFANYKDWTLEFGGRYHLKPDARFDPYVSALFGFRRVDALPATLTVPDLGVVLSNVGFYDDSTVAMFGFDFGFEYKIGSNASVGAESGFRWQGKPGSLEGFEPSTGLSGVTDAGSRLALPVLGFVTFRFE